ncbi:MAG: hypothetical protein M5U28_44890 [Sandaracinaceae bacterium]|nr:hypothetical protein [Sandaracinaceae bacterium]
MSGGHGKAKGGGVRKLVIVLLLVAGVMLLHRFAVRTVGFDPSAMLALGFVVLASYTFGQLVERIGLPHITGYLIAGSRSGLRSQSCSRPDGRSRPSTRGCSTKA